MRSGIGRELGLTNEGRIGGAGASKGERREEGNLELGVRVSGSDV